MKLLLAFLFLGLASAQWIDYRLVSSFRETKRSIGLQRLGTETTTIPQTTSPSKTPPIVCTAPGRVCDPDCKRIWTCIKSGTEFKSVLIQTCDNGQTCNGGLCSNVPTPECSPGGQKEFICQAEGCFPDPMSCKKFHICVYDNRPGGNDAMVHFKKECTGTLGYNPRTTYCDKSLLNNKCPVDYPVPLCKTPGQNGAIKENPSLHYTCSIYDGTTDILYPFIYLCEDGKIYDGNYGCK